MNPRAPLRAATIAMVEMSRGQPFADEDLYRLITLDEGDFSLSRVRGFLTILVRHRALVCIGRGWTGCRFKPGRRWETWRLAEPKKSTAGGNATAYRQTQAQIDRLHDLWRQCESHIRERIHAERTRQGLSLGCLAARIGVRKGHLSRLEHGSSDTKRMVALPVLVRVAIGLGMTLDQLVGWQEISTALSTETPEAP